VTEISLYGLPAKNNSPFEALSRASEHEFWSEPIDRCSASEMTRRCDPARAVQIQVLPMGTRIRFLGWYRPRIGQPLISYPPYDGGNMISRAGTGTGEPKQRLGVEETIHLFRSPFREGHGVFWRADYMPTSIRGRGVLWEALPGVSLL
jgi:hypothetical protein